MEGEATGGCFDVDVATGEGERNDFFFGHVTD